MRTSTQKHVRTLLRLNSDGMTVHALIEALKGIDNLTRTVENMRRTLHGMPDTYVDRWELRDRKACAAVWCVVVPPEDCPKPKI